ncbi:MAG: 4Fe-4S binding protein [Bauldia sp.]
MIRRKVVQGVWSRVAALLLAMVAMASAARADAPTLTLAERLTPDLIAVVYPGAERVGKEEGNPKAAPVYKGTEVVGYIFSTLDVVRSPGYSSVPFDIIAGVDKKGLITGAKLIYNEEPHVRGDSIRTGQMATFLDRLAGFNAQGPNAGFMSLPAEYVGGATISARAMKAGIIDSAKLVLRARGGRPPVTAPTLDVETFTPATFADLTANKAVVNRSLTSGEVANLIKRAGKGGRAEVEPGPPDELYTNFYTALASVPSVGRNLLGINRYKASIESQPRGTHTILVASMGPYDVQGVQYLKKSAGNIYDRVRLVQGDKTFVFDGPHSQPIAGIGGAGVPALRSGALFFIPPTAGFDPLQPWTIELLINGAEADGTPWTVAAPLPYAVPSAYVLLPDPPPVPPYVEAWQGARMNVIVLCVALSILTLILLFQNELTKKRHLFRWLRNGFLLFTLVWIGWIAGAQLSVVHLQSYIQGPFRGLDLGFYLNEPLMVIIAGYTLVSLIALGRGVFCGWLCPFGALQELLGQIAKVLRLPQWNPPDWLNRKLWLVKYVMAGLVLTLIFLPPEASAVANEVEPFKTAITSKFIREWPYVLYAGALLAMGLFTERAYCRYLCPLGGTLAFLDRLHLVDMLKRRPECGKPCQLCAHSCPVKAIVPSGEIKMAECFQCLDCQVEYHDDHRCPPLVRARKHGIRGNIVLTTPKNRPAGVPVAARGAEGAATA